jgi:amino acid permease
MQLLLSVCLVAFIRGSPWVAVALLTAVIAYEVLSGELVDFRWQTWVTRSDRPRKYWAILTIEVVVLLGFLCLGVLSGQ